LECIEANAVAEEKNADDDDDAWLVDTSPPMESL
jgi:hypothetical protein